jgi:predicted tellurium resistance membrane protein TerC
MFEWSDVLTIFLLVLLEGLLSADNAMVLAVLVLGLPPDQQKKALRFGILGAFFFRTVATLGAVYVIRFSAVKVIGAAYLLYLPYHHFFNHTEGRDRRTPPKAIPVAVAMSSKTWVILAGGLLGIVAMRLVIGKLLALVQRYPALVDGAFVIIAWVGIKLLIEFLHTIGYIHLEIPKWASLGVIVVIFAAALWYARRESQLNGP